MQCSISKLQPSTQWGCMGFPMERSGRLTSRDWGFTSVLCIQSFHIYFTAPTWHSQGSHNGYGVFPYFVRGIFVLQLANVKSDIKSWGRTHCCNWLVHNHDNGIVSMVCTRDVQQNPTGIAIKYYTCEMGRDLWIWVFTLTGFSLQNVSKAQGSLEGWAIFRSTEMNDMIRLG